MQVHTLSIRELPPDCIGLWERTVAQMPIETPFLHPQFVQMVGRARNDVEVALIESGSGLAGFFPYHRGRGDIARPVGLKLADFQGVVAPPSLEVDPLELLQACGLSGWDVSGLLGDAALMRLDGSRRGSSPFIDLRDGFEPWRQGLQSRGGSTIRSVSRKIRKIQRELGPLRLKTEASDRALQSLLRWKSDQRRRTQSLDVARFRWARRLLGDASSFTADGFSGMLSSLYAGDHFVAAHLGIRTDRTLHWWIPAYNPAYAKYSPGLILLVELARAGAALGIQRIDLGKGAERYKSSFSTGSVQVGEGILDRQPARAVARRLWLDLKRLARSVPLARQTRHLLHGLGFGNADLRAASLLPSAAGRGPDEPQTNDRAAPGDAR